MLQKITALAALIITWIATSNSLAADIVDCRQAPETALAIHQMKEKNQFLNTPIVQHQKWIGTVFYSKDKELKHLFICGLSSQPLAMKGNLEDLKQDDADKKLDIKSKSYDISIKEIQFYDLAPDLFYKLKIDFITKDLSEQNLSFSAEFGFYILEESF